MKCSLDISNFLEEISGISHSIVSLIFFALITEEVFFISPCYSLELCTQVGISFLFSFAFSFSSFLRYCLVGQPFCLFALLFLGIKYQYQAQSSVVDNYTLHLKGATAKSQSRRLRKGKRDLAENLIYNNEL